MTRGPTRAELLAALRTASCSAERVRLKAEREGNADVRARRWRLQAFVLRLAADALDAGAAEHHVDGTVELGQRDAADMEARERRRTGRRKTAHAA